MTDPLETLRNQFIARCRFELEQLRGLAHDDPELGVIAHRLAGSAGAFGYPQVSAAAARVDDRVRHGPELTPEDVQILIRALETAFNPQGA